MSKIESRNGRTLSFRYHPIHFVLVLLFLYWLTYPTHAAELNPDVQKRVEQYKQKLSEWAQDPTIIKAVQAANEKPPTISNDQWKSLPDSDPAVTNYQTNDAGKQVAKWQGDKNLGKIFVRDGNGNLVAGDQKPALFNIADRPVYTNAIRGKVWADNSANPDPTTKTPAVQISAPVISGGKTIGLIHTAVNAQ